MDTSQSLAEEGMSPQDLIFGRNVLARIPLLANIDIVMIELSPMNLQRTMFVETC
jgi:hypothetical protein